MRFWVVVDTPSRDILAFETRDLDGRGVVALMNRLVRYYGGEPGIRIATTRLHEP